MSESINWSVARGCLRAVGISALEGAALAALAAAAVLWSVGPDLERAALGGLGWAWAVSTLSVAVLACARPVSFKAFMWAFGAGSALRVLVLGGLVLQLGAAGPRLQSAAAVPYILLVVLLLAVEYRHLKA